MTHRLTYELVVDWDDDGCTARIDGDDSPLRGHGETPILALAELVKALVEWPQGGAERWLNTPSGVQLARIFVPDFEPGGPVPQS